MKLLITIKMRVWLIKRDSLRNLVGLLQEQGAAQEAAQLQDSFNA